jgi:hypothetical protein
MDALSTFAGLVLAVIGARILVAAYVSYMVISLQS